MERLRRSTSFSTPCPHSCEGMETHGFSSPCPYLRRPVVAGACSQRVSSPGKWALTKCICTHILRAVNKLTRLELCNCFAVRQASRYLTKLYERHLAGAELTSAQFSILVGLDEAGQMTMNELAKAMVMDRTTLLRAIKPLQRDELVVSRPSADDVRRLVFSLSAAGVRRLKKALALWSDAQQELESVIGSGEAARLRRELFALARSA
jgi:DNA-binding MarR family transcriptional regulator